MSQWNDKLLASISPKMYAEEWRRIAYSSVYLFCSVQNFICFIRTWQKWLTEAWLMAGIAWHRSSNDAVCTQMSAEMGWCGRGCAQLWWGQQQLLCALPAQQGAALGTAVSVQFIFLTTSMRSKLQSSPKLLLDRLYTPKWHDPALLQQQRISVWRPAAASPLCLYTPTNWHVVFSVCQLMKTGFN